MTKEAAKVNSPNPRNLSQIQFNLGLNLSQIKLIY